MRRALKLLWAAAALALATQHTFAFGGGHVEVARPMALALLALVPWFPPWRALALSMLALALSAPLYRAPQREVWAIVRDDGAPGPDTTLRVTDGDLELALQRAAATLPERGQIALFSAGRERSGDVMRAARDLAVRRIQLFVAMPTAPPHEVSIAALDMPSTLAVGTPFELSATLRASHPIAVTLALAEDDAVRETRRLELPQGDSVQRFAARAHAGETKYRLTLTPHGPDQDATNNAFEQRALVRERPRILVLDTEPARLAPFSELLREADFEVDRQAAPLADYDFVILSDLPAHALPSQRALLDYVRDGGGLLVAGGEHAFGPGGYRGSVIERLLPVTLLGSDARNEASLALVLAIDKSGSMAGDKLERAKEAALATAALLPEDAYLGIIGFDVEASRIVRLSRARPDPDAISRLAAGGGTALFPALDAAYTDLAGVRAQRKHVVVLTDGQTQEEALAELVRAMHADGITLSAVGLGADVQRGLLEAVAKLAHGRAYFTRDPSQIPRLFAAEAERVARSLVIEREIPVRQVAQAAFLRGVAIADAPPLRGFVRTVAKPHTTVLATEDGAPLLARMRYGEGWSLAWTSDLKPRWSAPWFGWPPQGQLFAQLVREHMRASETLVLEPQFRGDELQVTAEVNDERGRFVNGLTGTVEVRRDREPPRNVPFEAVAPGRYVARVRGPIDVGASYALKAHLGERRGRATVVPPAPSAEARLMTAALLTGGGRLPSPTPPLSGGQDAPPLVLAPTFLWAALAGFLLDVGARRLRRSEPGRRRGA